MHLSRILTALPPVRGLGFIQNVVTALETNPDHARYLVAEKILAAIYPKLNYSDYGRVWMDDKDFIAYMTRFDKWNFHSADRKWFLRSLLGLVDGLDGDTAECGVFKGATSWLICEHFRESSKTHFIFDSFEGVSTPESVDGQWWKAGALAASEAEVRSNLAGCRIETLPGWIPDRFSDVSDRAFCFVHIDVDLYQPTLDSLAFFYHHMVPGGVIICDDYGFSTCPGARKAMDEYMSDKPEAIIDVPTAQGFIIKQ